MQFKMKSSLWIFQYELIYHIIENLMIISPEKNHNIKFHREKAMTVKIRDSMSFFYKNVCVEYFHLEVFNHFKKNLCYIVQWSILYDRWNLSSKNILYALTTDNRSLLPRVNIELYALKGNHANTKLITLTFNGWK